MAVEAEVVALRTSGAPNAEISSTWISYDTAPVTSVQSNVTGDGDRVLVGVRRERGAAGRVRGRVGGAVASASTLATNASPQKISGSPAQARSNAPGVVVKSGE